MSQHSEPPEHRVSIIRVAIIVVSLVAALVAGFLLFFGVPKFAESTPGTMFAGYVDVTAEPKYHFESPINPATEAVILGFVVADKTNPCAPSWGGVATLEQAATTFDIDRRIEQLRISGGNARVSFGGAANEELATTCTDEGALAKAYQSVVDRYELTSIDFDIEGDALRNAASIDRRAKALRAVQESRPEAAEPLAIWVTLPVALTGLLPDGERVVDAMLAAGVELAGVNAMTMNYGDALPPGVDMSNASEQSVIKMNQQLVEIFARHGQELSNNEMWTKIGMTPMIGQNDVPTEQFSLGDAASVNAFALERRIAQLSMWSLNRDQTCGVPLPKQSDIVYNTCSSVDQRGVSFAETLWANTKVPALPLPSEPPLDGSSESASPSATSSAGPSGSASASPGAEESANVAPDSVVDDITTSPYVIWDPAVSYPVNTKVVWHKQVYEAKKWTSGFAPDTQVARPQDTPWLLIGPVMPNDKPAPLPTLPPDTYPQWRAEVPYQAGARVQVGLVPYQAKWFSQGQLPNPTGGATSPWALVSP